MQLFSILYSYLFFFILSMMLHNFSPESVESVERIPMFMSGASAIYFLFLARSLFSKLMTLHSFLIGSISLFVVNHVHVLDIGILLVIFVSLSFFFSYYFMSNDLSTDKNLDKSFFLIFLCRFFMSPEVVQWEIALVLELIFLFGFHYREYQEYPQHRKGVFFSLTLLFLLAFFYCNSTGVIRDMNIVVVLVLAAAGAGGVQFMCLSKTEREQTFALLVYIISNVILGFILRKEGETFPKITILFIICILSFFIFIFFLSKIKDQSIYSVLSESKTTLRGVFFSALYLLNALFLHDSYVDLNPWIASFIIQILVLMLLQFILKKEDEAPDREGDQGEKNKNGI